MNGRCETDPLDQAVDVCDRCYGEFCPQHLVYPKGRRNPFCGDCAIAASGVRGNAKAELRGSRRTAKKRRTALRAAEAGGDELFRYFDHDDPLADDGHPLDDPSETTEPKKGKRRLRSGRKDEHDVAATAADESPTKRSPAEPEPVDAAADEEEPPTTIAVAKLERIRRQEQQPDAADDAAADDPLIDEIQAADPDRPMPPHPSITETAPAETPPPTPERADSAAVTAAEPTSASPEPAEPEPVVAERPSPPQPEPVTAERPTPPQPEPVTARPSTTPQPERATTEPPAPPQPEPVATEPPAPRQPEPVAAADLGPATTEPSDVDPTPVGTDSDRQPHPDRAPGALPLPNRQSKQRRSDDVPGSAGPEQRGVDRRKPDAAPDPDRPKTAPMIGEVRNVAGRRADDRPTPEPAGASSPARRSGHGQSLNAIDEFDADRPKSETTDRPTPQEPSADDAAPDVATSGDNADRADVDASGNWIPPILRGMAPDAREAKANLPKRRGKG